jgi:hypothetical protein
VSPKASPNPKAQDAGKCHHIDAAYADRRSYLSGIVIYFQSLEICDGGLTLIFPFSSLGASSCKPVQRQEENMLKLLYPPLAAAVTMMGASLRWIWILSVAPVAATIVWINKYTDDSDRLARMLIVLGLLFEIGGIVVHHWAGRAEAFACLCFAAAAIFTALSVVIDKRHAPRPS